MSPALVALAACALGGLSGYVLRAQRLFVLLIGLAAALAALFVWAIVKGRAAPSGWDGVGYAIAAILMLAPALIGLGLGAALAWWRGRK